MAELPGWDRDRLALALPADVDAARWRVFADRLMPLATGDFRGQREALAMHDLKGPALERAERRARLEAIEALKAAERAQVDTREVLMLDDEDEDDG
jgi:hypothetical protein